MIVRLKVIESREDIFCYLSSYLHRSFLWHLFIVTFIYYIIKLSSRGQDLWLYQECPLVLKMFARIVVPSDCSQAIELLRRSLEDSSHAVLVIVSLSKCGVSVLSDQPFWNLSGPRRNFIQLMNHILTSNHPSGSICVNPLDHLELRLDLLLSPLHKEDGPLPHRKDGLPLHREGLVKADVDVLKVRSSRV